MKKERRAQKGIVRRWRQSVNWGNKSTLWVRTTKWVGEGIETETTEQFLPSHAAYIEKKTQKKQYHQGASAAHAWSERSVRFARIKICSASFTKQNVCFISPSCLLLFRTPQSYSSIDEQTTRIQCACKPRVLFSLGHRCLTLCFLIILSLRAICEN